MDAAEAMLNRSTITGDAVAHVQRLAPGRRTIVFCCGIKHSLDVAQQFRDAGIEAAHIDGTTPVDDQRRAVADFRSGKLKVLSSVDLLTTGVDIPEIEAALDLRPTQSLALQIQKTGRILRISPGKANAVLIDAVGNTMRHGLPNADREWSLDGVGKKTSAQAVRQCPECYAAFKPAARCPECGLELAGKGKPRAVEHRAGELIEITTDEAGKQKMIEASLKDLVRAARTVDDLRIIALVRGYNPRWVGYIAKFKFAKSE